MLTVDGRSLIGELISFDQVTNLVLGHSIERQIRPPGDPEPSTEANQGLYVLRGDNVVCVGLVDEELDKSIDWTKVRGNLIRDTRNT